MSKISKPEIYDALCNIKKQAQFRNEVGLYNHARDLIDDLDHGKMSSSDLMDLKWGDHSIYRWAKKLGLDVDL